MTNPHSQALKWGETLFKYRDYTPIPLIVILLFVAEPSVFTATIGTLVVIFGELLRLYSVAFIGSISRTRKDNLGSSLVTSGPFRWVRNPLYVGNGFIVLGVAIFAGSFWFTLLALTLFYAQYHFIVLYEEKLLEEKFGQAYLTYKAQVPAWFPYRLPSIAEIECPTSFAHALYSEKRTLLAIAAVLLLLILLD